VPHHPDHRDPSFKGTVAEDVVQGSEVENLGDVALWSSTPATAKAVGALEFQPALRRCVGPLNGLTPPHLFVWAGALTLRNSFFITSSFAVLVCCFCAEVMMTCDTDGWTDGWTD
jgi:hypothetical protein